MSDGGYQLVPYDPDFEAKWRRPRRSRAAILTRCTPSHSDEHNHLIPQREALAIRDRLLVLHGGAAGVNDEALLESALAKPRQAAACAGDPTIPDLAALYTAGIVKNHPFVDGNKRTGFLLGVAGGQAR